MFVLTEEQKNDELVKSLLDSGFGEDVVAGWIESGAVTIEKSTQSGPDDHGEGDGDGEHEKREKKGKKKTEDETGDDGESDPDDDGDEGLGDPKPKKEVKEQYDNLAKSISADILKSIEEKVEEGQNDIMKSLPSLLEDALQPLVDKIEKSLDGMRQAIVAFGDKAPSFKGANLSKAVIEKSIENGGGAKDEQGKMALSVSRDRHVVRELILKSIDEEKDAEIQKSLRENTTAYILDPVEGAIGEPAAKYFFENKNVRLVK